MLALESVTGHIQHAPGKLFHKHGIPSIDQGDFVPFLLMVISLGQELEIEQCVREEIHFHL
jgi:hypothetical protein